MFLDFFYSFLNTILLIVNKLGYLGIFVGMAIESSIFPLPSELILIPAGALVAKGQMSFFLVFIAGILGSIVGSWLCYLVALALGRKSFDFLIGKYGSFLLIEKTNLKTAEDYFRKHGKITIFIGRLLPVIRHLISFPAGFAKMNFLRFTLYTGIGAGIFIIFLILVGYFFGSNAHPVLKWLIGIIFVLCSIIALIYYLRKRKK